MWNSLRSKALWQLIVIIVALVAPILVLARWQQKWDGVAMLVAVLAGPVIAVIVTRYIDDERAKDARRWDIFRTLMRSRLFPTSADFVGALNLIEVEFRENQGVVETWRELHRHAYSTPKPVSNEDWTRWNQQMSDIRARLLHTMATALSINIEQLEIFRGGYYPEHWDLLDSEQSVIKSFLLDIATGKRGVPIEVQQPSSTAT